MAAGIGGGGVFGKERDSGWAAGLGVAFVWRKWGGGTGVGGLMGVGEWGLWRGDGC